MENINPALTGTTDEIVQRISKHEPTFAQQLSDTNETGLTDRFSFNAENRIWVKGEDTAKQEAIIVCGGSLLYDRQLERTAAGTSYNFDQFFTGLRKSISSGDLAIASLNATVADMYPQTTIMSGKMSGRGHYSNARREYLDGIRYAGFDALALSNGYNLDAGVRGALATEQNVQDHGIAPSGLGRNKMPVFEVNGIRVALLSYSMEVNLSETVTDSGRDALLNIFSPERATSDIHEARSRGAKFIISYLDSRTLASKYSRKDREATAQAIAEAGADYIICTQPNAITRYSKYTTSDGRVVPIASGMGALLAGLDRPYTKVSALLRITLRVSEGGNLEMSDSYIPTHRHPWERGGILPVAAAHSYFGTSGLDTETVKQTEQTLRRLLGREIKVDETRRLTHRTPGHAQLSPAEISHLLGVKFSDEALALLGKTYHTPVEIVGTHDTLHAGACAVIMKYQRGNPDWSTQFKGISPSQFKEIKPVMAIATTSVPETPTLVVSDPWNSFMNLLSTVRSKYSPLTIAVTGTAGKTTTKEMLSTVFSRHEKTLYLNGNWNTESAAASTIMKLTDSDKVYIQEVHGATPGSASANSRMTKPNISIITSIAEGHLEQMGSIENIVKGKLGIIDGLAKDGVLILNNDNEYLRKVSPNVRTIRYGIENKENDYFARNIKVHGQQQDFEVVEPDGSVHLIHLEIPGLHNVSNALATYAAAREARVKPHIAIAGLSRYRSSATRQNILDKGGYRIFLDAYNSNVLSLSNALDTLEQLSPIGSSGRRIVVMGDMGEQGDKFVENHELIGRKISMMNFDMFYGIGEGAKLAEKMIKTSTMTTSSYSEFSGLVASLSQDIRPGDVILFKAAGGMDLTNNVVFPLFGKIV